MVNQVKTEEIANFTSAITAGFELLLERYDQLTTTHNVSLHIQFSESLLKYTPMS